jgi:hypothetical protein
MIEIYIHTFTYTYRMPVKKSWDILSRVHKHARDSRIVFEEDTHTYKIDGDTSGWCSVTEFLKKFHEPFDPKKCANAVMNSRKYKDGTHPLSGKSEEDIIEYWNGENKKGTAFHARMERAMNRKFHLNLRSHRHSSGELILEKVKAKFLSDIPGSMELQTKTVLLANRNHEVYTYDHSIEFADLSGTFLGYLWEDGTVRRNPLSDSELGEEEPILSYKEAVIETEQVNSFWKTHSHLKPYRSEWVVWDADWKIAGTIDGVFQDTRDKTYWILDWKRVRSGLEVDLEATRWGYIQKDDEWLEPVKPWAKKMPAPLNDLYSTKYWNYSLQLNLYRTILEKSYGVRIKGMELVQFHPDMGDECKAHPVMRMERAMDKILPKSTETEDRCDL